MNKSSHLLAKDFEEYLLIDRGVTKITLQAYLLDLRRMMGSCFLENLAREDVIFLMQALDQKNYSRSTKARSLTALRLYSQFLISRGIIDKDPTLRLLTPKRKQNEKLIPSKEQLMKLLDSPDVTSEMGIRDHAILQLLYGSGLRVSELINLTLFSVTDGDKYSEKDRGIKTYMGAFITVRGKGDKKRVVPLHEKGRESLDRYLSIRRAKRQTETNLFLNKNGLALSRQAAWNIIKKYAKELFPSSFSIYPHLIRHAFATHLIEEGGAEIYAVQKMLGHSSIETTERYYHKGMKEAFEEFHRVHPLAH